jgi:hypothetical protein
MHDHVERTTEYFAETTKVENKDEIKSDIESMNRKKTRDALSMSR